MDEIKVYRFGKEPVMVPRDQIIWTDRSRMDEQCLRKRYLSYEYGGTGFVPMARNEDLLIGGAVHEGVDLLLQGGSLEKALAVAGDLYLEGRPWGDWLLPEQKEILIQDGLHLVKALVYIFHVCYLEQYREQYQTLEVEEEINWSVRKIGDKHLVCMSRPDAVLRDRATGRIWHVSHKTTKRFDDIVLQRLDVDIQRFAEGYAIWAKFGEPPEGTFYNYFIKGDRRRDEQSNLDRYTTGLIRPYVFRMAGGELTPEQVQFSYEWQILDSSTGAVSKKRVGKGWEKADIFREMNYMTYLDWLRERWVKNEGTDYLIESIAGMVPTFWDRDHARRWLDGIRKSEEDWTEKVHMAKRAGGGSYEQVMNHHFPLATQQCFSYNQRCQHYDICWRGKTPDTLLEEGILTHREPNHLQEFYEVM